MVSTYGYVVPLAMFTTIIALSHHPNTRLTLVTLHQKVRLQSWLCLQIHCHLQAGFFKYIMVTTKRNVRIRFQSLTLYCNHSGPWSMVGGMQKAGVCVPRVAATRHSHSDRNPFILQPGKCRKLYLVERWSDRTQHIWPFMAIGPCATNSGKWGIPEKSYENVAQQW